MNKGLFLLFLIAAIIISFNSLQKVLADNNAPVCLNPSAYLQWPNPTINTVPIYNNNNTVVNSPISVSPSGQAVNVSGIINVTSPSDHSPLMLNTTGGSNWNYITWTNNAGNNWWTGINPSGPFQIGSYAGNGTSFNIYPSGAIALTPTSQPTNPVPGMMYFDSNPNIETFMCYVKSSNPSSPYTWANCGGGTSLGVLPSGNSSYPFVLVNPSNGHLVLQISE